MPKSNLTETHTAFLERLVRHGYDYASPDNFLTVADLLRCNYVRLETSYDGLEVHITHEGRQYHGSCE